jgi:hypothetical protein
MLNRTSDMGRFLGTTYAMENGYEIWKFEKL